MSQRRELCPTCQGDGAVKIPGGLSVCDTCHGDCWAPLDKPRTDRLRALIVRWRANHHEQRNDFYGTVAWLECADQLEAALMEPAR